MAGKFGIGARVRHDGDIAEIIGKPEKGKRELRIVDGDYEGMIFWAPKRELEPVNDWQVKSADGASSLSFADGTFKVEAAFIDAIEPTGAVDTCTEKGEVAFKVGDRVVMVRPRDGEFSPVVARIIGDDGQDYLPLHIEFEGEVDFGHSEPATWYVSADDLTPFTLSAGKFYRTRDGRKVGPMEPLAPWSSECMRDVYGRNAVLFARSEPVGQKSYAADGMWLTSHGDHKNDIVAEWVEPAAAEPAVAPATATPQPKFKVGDRVDLYRDGKPVEAWSNMTITAITGDILFPINTDVGLPCFERELRLSPALPVGTKVTLTGTVSGNYAGGVNILIDGLPPGSNSFAFPATALRAA